MSVILLHVCRHRWHGRVHLSVCRAGKYPPLLPSPHGAHRQSFLPQQIAHLSAPHFPLMFHVNILRKLQARSSWFGMFKIRTYVKGALDNFMPPGAGEAAQSIPQPAGKRQGRFGCCAQCPQLAPACICNPCKAQIKWRFVFATIALKISLARTTEARGPQQPYCFGDAANSRAEQVPTHYCAQS